MSAAQMVNKFELVGVLTRKPERVFWSLIDKSKYNVLLVVETYREWNGERKNYQLHPVEAIGEARDMAESLRAGEVVRLAGFCTGRPWRNPKTGKEAIIEGKKATVAEVVTAEAVPAPTAHEQAKANGFTPEQVHDAFAEEDIPF